MDEHIKKIADTLDFTPIKNIKTDIYLNDHEINILNHFEIDYNSCINTEELIYKIDYALNEYEEDLELEEVARTISERNYYMNTKK